MPLPVSLVVFSANSLVAKISSHLCYNSEANLEHLLNFLKPMKILNLLPLTLTLSAFAYPVYAGTEATNTYVHGTRDVESVTKVNNYRAESGTYDTKSTTTKLETNFPRANGYINVNGTNVTGHLNVNTHVTDPFVEASTVTQNTWGKFQDITTTTLDSTSNGTDTIYTHTISTDSF